MAGTNGDADWIALEGAANARVVVPGVLLRSDNLQSLTAPDVRLLVDEQAVEVVLDLRTDIEVELEGPSPIMREPRVRVEHRSLYPSSGGNTDLDAVAETLWPGADSSEWPEETRVVQAYMRYMRARPDSIVASIRTIADTGGAVLVHCAAGKDRTGVVVALALDAAGVSRDAIISDYMASAERIYRSWNAWSALRPTGPSSRGAIRERTRRSRARWSVCSSRRRHVRRVNGVAVVPRSHRGRAPPASRRIEPLSRRSWAGVPRAECEQLVDGRARCRPVRMSMSCELS